MPPRFRSKLVVRDSRGVEVTRKEIAVNDPLRIGGVSGLTMYQADWGVASVRVRARLFSRDPLRVSANEGGRESG